MEEKIIIINEDEEKLITKEEQVEEVKNLSEIIKNNNENIQKKPAEEEEEIYIKPADAGESREEEEPPAPIEDISTKYKKRIDYINAIKRICIKFDLEPPEKLLQRKKKELKILLAEYLEKGARKVQNIQTAPELEHRKVSLKEEYAITTLYNLNKCFLSVCENLSYSYKNNMGGRYVKNVVKNLESNDNTQIELKRALRGIYLEYKDEIDSYCSPLLVLLMVNISLLMGSLTTDEIEENKKNIKTYQDNNIDDKENSNSE